MNPAIELNGGGKKATRLHIGQIFLFLSSRTTLFANTRYFDPFC